MGLKPARQGHERADPQPFESAAKSGRASLDPPAVNRVDTSYQVAHSLQTARGMLPHTSRNVCAALVDCRLHHVEVKRGGGGEQDNLHVG